VKNGASQSNETTSIKLGPVAVKTNGTPWAENPKLEIRNPKQAPMSESEMSETRALANRLVPGFGF
jgi:hypothetical protein